MARKSTGARADFLGAALRGVHGDVKCQLVTGEPIPRQASHEAWMAESARLQAESAAAFETFMAASARTSAMFMAIGAFILNPACAPDRVDVHLAHLREIRAEFQAIEAEARAQWEAAQDRMLRFHRGRSSDAK